VMEYVEGKMMNSMSLTELHINKVANVLHHFSTITRTDPGSLSGGPSTGLLWPDTNDLVINKVSQIEDWFNSRLWQGQGQVSLQYGELVLNVFCHLDIAPRNIIWQKDDCICLLDWASAGFYPRLLELVTQWIGKEGTFNGMLIHAMDPSNTEFEQRQRICQALSNNQRYLCRRLDSNEKALCRNSGHIHPLPPPLPPLVRS